MFIKSVIYPQQKIKWPEDLYRIEHKYTDTQIIAYLVFVEFAFAIYDLICKIKFRLRKK